MAEISLGGQPVNTIGELPEIGTAAPDFKLVATDLSISSLNDFKGQKLVLNIFPSIDTSTCATSVRKFNELASSFSNTKVLCISRDLPFAQKRFCGAEGINDVINLSDFKGRFGQDYGLELIDGKLSGLHARAVMTIDENGKLIYSELVSDIKNEPNYDAALASLAN